jgi:hypothetical protein
MNTDCTYEFLTVLYFRRILVNIKHISQVEPVYNVGGTRSAGYYVNIYVFVLMRWRFNGTAFILICRNTTITLQQLHQIYRTGVCVCSPENCV